MNYWITTDTHFGHKKLMEYSGRPENFERLILKRHQGALKDGGVLIHLGDFCIGKDAYWHERFMDYGHLRRVKKWLIRGNHDKKSTSWYLNHGWDFVAHEVKLKLYGLNIVLSHIPIEDSGYDINVHGHFHNANHRRHEQELLAIKNDKHRLVMLEHDYTPVLLRRVVGK